MADLAKIIDELSALTVMEAADLVKQLEEKWGVEAASGAPVMMAAAGGGDGGGGGGDGINSATGTSASHLVKGPWISSNDVDFTRST